MILDGSLQKSIDCCWVSRPPPNRRRVGNDKGQFKITLEHKMADMVADRSCESRDLTIMGWSTRFDA